MNIQKYIPSEAYPIITNWIETYKAEIKITKTRISKLGDYRHPFNGKGHRISINGSLNQYAFLITLVHEFAHLVTWNQHKHNVKPHGIEWKINYHIMMKRFLELRLFPEQIHNILLSHIKNPPASSCSDISLQKALNSHNFEPDDTLQLLTLPDDSIFKTSHHSRYFKKIKVIRKRILCQELTTKRLYSFNPLHYVEQIQ